MSYWVLFIWLLLTAVIRKKKIKTQKSNSLKALIFPTKMVDFKILIKFCFVLWNVLVVLLFSFLNNN